MNLNMRCAYCSAFKQAESKSDSALSRLDAAYRSGWTAVANPKTFIISYYCSTKCEDFHRRNGQRHLSAVKPLTTPTSSTPT